MDPFLIFVLVFVTSALVALIVSIIFNVKFIIRYDEKETDNKTLCPHDYEDWDECPDCRH